MERISAWRDMYGVDFSTLLATGQTATEPFMVRNDEVVTWQRVAPPVSLVAIDLTRPFELTYRKQASFTLECDAERLGALLAFRATLAPGIVLSTLPDEAAPENHWRYALWPSFTRPSVARGGTATIDYQYGRGMTTLEVS